MIDVGLNYDLLLFLMIKKKKNTRYTTFRCEAYSSVAVNLSFCATGLFFRLAKLTPYPTNTDAPPPRPRPAATTTPPCLCDADCSGSFLGVEPHGLVLSSKPWAAHFICVTSSRFIRIGDAAGSLLFQGSAMCCFACVPHSPSTREWTCGLLPRLADCDQRCSERRCANLSLRSCSEFFGAYTQKWDCCIAVILVLIGGGGTSKLLSSYGARGFSTSSPAFCSCDGGHSRGREAIPHCGFDLRFSYD